MEKKKYNHESKNSFIACCVNKKELHKKLGNASKQLNNLGRNPKISEKVEIIEKNLSKRELAFYTVQINDEFKDFQEFCLPILDLVKETLGGLKLSKVSDDVCKKEDGNGDEKRFYIQ